MMELEIYILVINWLTM